MEWLLGPVWLWVIGLFILFLIARSLRRVVPTNEVHILQKGNKTIIKWRGFEWWNVYYKFPEWVPKLWVSVTRLPLFVFDVKLVDYQAYDNWKVPFKVDVTAFFVIRDPEIAATRIADFAELQEQLVEVVRGAVRKTLAQYDIRKIMESRSEIWQEFYQEVTQAVKEWWVELKNTEFMDIRDADWYNVIRNLLEKKRKQIETEAAEEVARKEAEKEMVEAEEKKKAELVKIQAEQEAQLKRIEAEKLIKAQEVEKNKLVALQEQEAKQMLLEKEKETKTKELEIKLLEEQKQAEIEKVKEIIEAEKQKEKEIIQAEAKKEKELKEAEAKAKAIEMEAEAKAKALEKEAEAKRIAIEKEWFAKAKTIDYVGTAEAKNKLEMAKALNAFSEVALIYLIKEMEIKYLQILIERLIINSLFLLPYGAFAESAK